MSKKKKAKRKLSFFDTLLIVLCLCIAGYCIYKIYPTLNQYYQGQKENRELRKKAVSHQHGKTDEQRALSRYINFAYLRRINKDVIAWIWVPGTAIDYPVLKGPDDQYYLHRNIYRRYRYPGSIFMETECKRDFSSNNTILYGHNMRDGSMFASLNRYSRKGFMRRHPGVYIYMPGKNRTVKCYRAFSYNVTTMSKILYTNNPPSFWDYVNRAKQGAQVTMKQKKKGKTLMLSTCYTGHYAYRRILFSTHQRDVNRPKR